MHRLLYRGTRRWASWILTALLSVLPTAVLAGANPFFTLPLHAKISSGEPCDGYLPVNCEDVQPTVRVPPNSDIVVFLFVYNYAHVSGLWTDFDWPAAWTLLDYDWFCQPGQVSFFEIGAGFGRLRTAFSCAVGPALLPIGRLDFHVGQGGCLDQLTGIGTSPYVIDCSGEVDQIMIGEVWRVGSVCALAPGRPACDVLTTPAEASTWGQIKARSSQ